MMKVSPGQDPNIGGVVTINTDLGEIQVSIARPTITLVQALFHAQTSDEFVPAIKEADPTLDRWVDDRRGRSTQHEKFVLSLGAEITFPPDAWGRS